MKDYGFLGCDVSKGYCDFQFVDWQEKRLVPAFQLDDAQKGHKSLLDLLVNHKQSNSLTKIIVGLESTGGYENNWYSKLRSKAKQLNIEVFRINPKRIYHSGKVEGVMTTNDRISAGVIANYLVKNYGKNALTTERHDAVNDATLGKRKLWKYIKLQKVNNAKLKGMLEKNLYITMPELLSLKGEKYPKWFLNLLSKYPSRKAILKAGIEKLMKISHVSERKAELILNRLNQSVNQYHESTLAILIKDLAKQILEGEKRVNKLEELFVSLIQEDQNKDINIITSIRGIRKSTAAILLLEFGSIKRFKTSKNIVAFFGVHPTYKKSGDKHYKIGMSKAGSKIARAILFMAAKNVVIHEPYFKSLYLKYKQQGRAYNDIMGIIMAKLLRVLYGMLKKQQTFDPGVDRYHQLNIKYNQKVKLNMSKIKSNENSLDAPISAREKKKRMQEQLSQTE